MSRASGGEGGRFLGSLKAVDLPDGRRRRLLEPFRYRSALLARVIEVPEGFVYDGASIPRALWWLIGGPFTGRYRRAALLHDYLYTVRVCSREEADQVLLEAMVEDRVPKWRRWAMFQAVRLGGGAAWRAATEQ